MYGSTPAESIPIPKTERTKDVYYKNERDMSNHWKATAANAIKPLQNMIVMATDNLMKKVLSGPGD